MRVLIVSPYPPQRDGLASYSRHLAAALEARGDAVAVVTVRPAARADVLGCLRGEPDAAALAWRPDVVHVQHTIAGYGPALPALWRLVRRLRAAGVPVVVTHHEVTRDVARLGAAGRAYYRRVARHADAVHVHTKAAAALHGGDPVVLAHPVAPLPPATVGADALRDRYGLGARPVLLCFGFVHVDKGLDTAVEAAAAVGDVDLVVAGEVRGRPWPLKRYEWQDRRHLAAVSRRAAALGVRLTHTGYVPAGEFRAWFDAASVVLLPYRRAEHSGVAQLAVAAGAPVLATPVGGLAEMFAGTPSLTAGTGAADVTGGLRRLLADPPPRGAALDDSTFGALRELYRPLAAA
jgi:glycosyltransferase involved in cell wall biosynthesis